MYKYIRIAFISTILFASFFLNKTDVFGQVTAAQEIKIEAALPSRPINKPKTLRTLLVFSRTEGYRHDSIIFANKAFELMGKKTGAFNVVFSEDMSVFAPENIKKFDAILLNNTTGLKFEDPVKRKSLLDFVRNGKGLIGIHAATDNFYNWDEAAEMIGGQFDGHPWNGNGTWAVEITDPGHNLNAGFPYKNFRVSDEIYRHKHFNLRENCRVLVSLNMRDKVNLEADGVRFTDKDVPISWVRNFGKGRIFFCSFGHNPPIFWNVPILQHYLAGIQFALGDLPVNTKPVPFNIEQMLDFTQLESLLDQVALYKFGESLTPLQKLREFVTLAHQSPKARQRIEKRLIKFLQSDATLAGKQNICHLLSVYGTKKSVKTLAKMLNDSSTVEMARFALEKIPDMSVNKVLRKALLKSRGKTKVGIINSLSERRDIKAVPIFNKMIYSSDKAIAAAAIAALGKIASESAIETLSTARKTIGKNLQFEVVDAYLNCADNLVKQQKNLQAIIIYNELFKTSENNTVRYAALNGLVHAGAPGVGDMLIQVLKNDNAKMRTGVAMIVRNIPAAHDIGSIVKALPLLGVEDQVRMLGALSNRTDPDLLKTVTALAKSQHDNVRITALQTIGEIGDTSSVHFLAKIAAQQNADAAAARMSLYRLHGKGIDRQIVKLILNSDSKIKLQLIRSLKVRQPADSESIIANTLLGTAQDNDAKIRVESIKALQVIAGQDKVSQLVDLLIKASNEKERSALEKAIAAISLKKLKNEQDNSESTELLLAVLSTETDTQIRRSLLLILAKIGHELSLPVIKEALHDSDDTIKLAATRALAQWPTDEPAQELEKIIRTSSNELQRVLALRGFVRLAGFPGDRTEAEITDRFKTALQLSGSDDDKKMVLSGLGTQESFSAFQLAVAQMSHPALYDEAEAAVVKIAGTILGKYPAETKKVLMEIRQNSKNKSAVNQAQQHINEIEKYEDFITLWQLSGPYRHDSEDTFYYEFLPEKSVQKAEWTTMTAISDKNAPWQVNLTNIYGGNFCVGYLRTNVWSELDQNARIELGSNDGIKAWFNGKLILSNDTSRTVSPGSDIVEIRLKKGWNTVMLKIRQLGGTWGACARIRNVDGSKIKNLRYQPEK